MWVASQDKFKLQAASVGNKYKNIIQCICRNMYHTYIPNYTDLLLKILFDQRLDKGKLVTHLYSFFSCKTRIKCKKIVRTQI